MSEAVRETDCTRCVHRNICKHKKDFLDVVKAVNNVEVYSNHGDNSVSKNIVTNFDCVGDIIVTCRFAMPEKANSREGVF